MTFDKELFEDGNAVTMNEPAVGGGAMVIAMCDHLINEKINFQKQLKITCQDVDYTAVCMCYIQLSLIGCNAVVVHANTLSMEEWGSFYTPMARMFPIRSTHEMQPTIEMIAELPLQKTLTEFV